MECSSPSPKWSTYINCIRADLFLDPGKRLAVAGDKSWVLIVDHEWIPYGSANPQGLILGSVAHGTQRTMTLSVENEKLKVTEL
jgi:hypothetical protein